MTDQGKPPILKTGTTTVGLVTGDAVILGADRKATMGYQVASKETKKILQLDDHLAFTMAGLAGDGQALDRYMKAEVNLYRFREEKRITVKAAAHLLSNLLYYRRFYPYYVQLILGGYDTKPQLFTLDAAGSVQDETEYTATGSGSPYAYGVLENDYKKGLTTEQGKQLVAKAIVAATKRDIASGGRGIDVVVITKHGVTQLSENEISALMK
ncbi:MAG: archaeal proteasome endopeptidase complex subunit beta [Nanoarchaeota archaeon]|nr:archaeal proteasome endopeptidase complex subunit beta [Nanoarchaeota archaeon]